MVYIKFQTVKTGKNRESISNVSLSSQYE